MLTAPFRNYHCTSKPQTLTGQNCSKLILTNITWAIYFIHPPSLLASLSTFCDGKIVVCMADKKHCREGVFHQPYFAKEKFKEKHSMDVSTEMPLTSWIHCLAFSLLHSFVAFSDPCQVLLYDEVWKELHSDLLHVSRSTALSYWHNSVTSDTCKTIWFFYSLGLFLPSNFDKTHAPSFPFLSHTQIMLTLLYN